MEKQTLQRNHTLPSIKDGLTKRQVAELAEQSVQNVLEEANIFQVAEALAAMDEFVKTIRKDERYIQFMRDELTHHHGKLLTNSGAKIELCEAAVTYDYSNNAEWRILDEQIQILTDQRKKVEEKLRKVAQGKVVVDTDTGEVIEGPLKTSKSTYRITLAR
jgi:hypothetical protein